MPGHILTDPVRFGGGQQPTTITRNGTTYPAGTTFQQLTDAERRARGYPIFQPGPGEGEIGQYTTMDPLQRKMFEDWGAYLQQSIGGQQVPGFYQTAIDRYEAMLGEQAPEFQQFPGQTFQPSPYQALEGFVGGTAPAIQERAPYTPMTPEESQAFYMQHFYPMEQRLMEEQIIPQTREAFQGMGFWGSPRAEAESRRWGQFGAEQMGRVGQFYMQGEAQRRETFAQESAEATRIQALQSDAFQEAQRLGLSQWETQELVNQRTWEATQQIGLGAYDVASGRWMEGQRLEQDRFAGQQEATRLQLAMLPGMLGASEQARLMQLPGYSPLFGDISQFMAETPFSYVVGPGTENIIQTEEDTPGFWERVYNIYTR